MKKGIVVIVAVSALLTLMFLAGQTLGVFNYDAAVSIGMQESEEEIGKVGIAFAKGFGFADAIFYIPLLLLGIIGLLKNKKWGEYSMFGAMAITVYWPIVHLYAIFIERNFINLHTEKYFLYPIILGLIILYGLFGMWYLYKNKTKLT